MKIHFIGVGKMGLPMAGHLRSAGHEVTVEDLDPARVALAAAQGLEVKTCGAGICSAEAVFSSLPHDDALLAVAGMVASRASRGLVFVDTSTVSPQASAEAAQELDEAGVQYLRCTVSGNNKMAESAQLTTMVSGPRAAYERLLPLLSTLGPNSFYLGDGEQARLMKLVVNLMIVQTSAMLAEALALGRKGGLDWHDMWQVLGASAVASPILKAKGVQLVQRDFTPTFTVEQMLKDIGLILDAGAASDVPLPQTAMTQQLMRSAMAHGDGQQDYAVVIKSAERAAGLAPMPDARR